MKNAGKREFLSSRVRYISTEEIRPNPQQPRRSFEERSLRELTDSALYKLGQMRDEDFDALDLTPDFDTEDAAYGG